MFFFFPPFFLSVSSFDAYQHLSLSGIFSFAATTFLLSMFNVGTRGIQTSNVVVGMAIFAGGLLQFIAGMWEFPRGNVFGATGKPFLKAIMGPFLPVWNLDRRTTPPPPPRTPFYVISAKEKNRCFLTPLTSLPS
jgi:GPR1/FUN34/yaaH family